MQTAKSYKQSDRPSVPRPDSFGSFEKILLVSGMALAPGVKDALEGNLYDVDCVHTAADGVRKIIARDYDLIICDVLAPGFPAEMFHFGVNRLKPHLARNFIFITGHEIDVRLNQFIRKTGAMVLWTPLEMHLLFEAVNTVLHKSAAHAVRLAA